MLIVQSFSWSDSRTGPQGLFGRQTCPRYFGTGPCWMMSMFIDCWIPGFHFFNFELSFRDPNRIGQSEHQEASRPRLLEGLRLLCSQSGHQGSLLQLVPRGRCSLFGLRLSVARALRMLLELPMPISMWCACAFQ